MPHVSLRSSFQTKEEFTCVGPVVDICSCDVYVHVLHVRVLHVHVLHVRVLHVSLIKELSMCCWDVFHVLVL